MSLDDQHQASEETPNLLTAVASDLMPQPLDLDYWSQRYMKDGALWGEEPSPIATELIHRLPASSTVFEFGYGYGRDVVALAKEGHVVYGIDESSIGHSMAASRLRDLAKTEGLREDPLQAGKVFLVTGDFKNYRMSQGDCDAILSHRTWHLIHPKRINSVVNRMAGLLKPNGIAIVSARNPKDYNPKQMDLIENAHDGTPLTAKYKDAVRTGANKHIVNFWDADRIATAVAPRFSLVQHFTGTEIESVKNLDLETHRPLMTQFSVVVLRKKSDEEVRAWEASRNRGGGGGFSGMGNDEQGYQARSGLFAAAIHVPGDSILESSSLHGIPGIGI